jgi:hypothetical protein
MIRGGTRKISLYIFYKVKEKVGSTDNECPLPHFSSRRGFFDNLELAQRSTQFHHHLKFDHSTLTKSTCTQAKPNWLLVRLPTPSK